jgi:hypothetical protein
MIPHPDPAPPQRRRAALLLGLGAAHLMTLGACSGSGGSTSPPIEDELTAKSTFSADDVDHFLRRAHFGVTTAARAAIAQSGMPRFVDDMLAFPAVGSTSWEQEAARILLHDDDPPGLEGKHPGHHQIGQWWAHLILRNPNPFQEKLALFWHDHFAASSEALDHDERYWMPPHINLFRGLGTGNLKALVLAVARDPAMLQWLDGFTSTRSQPNENFAREFFELFTAGADQGYTEADIREAARAFTGYRKRYDAATNLSRAEFDRTRKDTGTKVLFGTRPLGGNAADVDDYDLVVAATFERLRVAEFISRKLLAAFCQPEPPASLVSALAASIRANDYEMRPVLRTLFLSRAFYSDTAKRAIVASPVDYAVGFVHTTGLLIPPEALDTPLAGMEHRPSQPPSVNGWPSGEAWLSAQGMVNRANFLRRVVIERHYQGNNGFKVAMPAGTPTAEQVVDHFAGLFGVELSDAERARSVRLLNTRVDNSGNVTDNPFVASDPRHVDERVRGLLFVLGQHPQYLVR